MYDDSKAVRMMEGEVAHIKPKQVYMLVYARREGDALWQSGALLDEGDGSGRAERGGSGEGVAASSGVVPGAQGSATGADAGTLVVVGSPGSGRRKLGRKTSEADWVRSGSGDGVCASPLVRLATTPERLAREGDALGQRGALLDQGDGSGRAERGGSGEGVVASSGVVPGVQGSATGAGAGTPGVVGSPGSGRRKLVRKTSEADWVRSGSGDGVCASPLIGLETTPERQVKRARMSACAGLSGAGADAGGFKTRRVTQEGSGSEDPVGASSVARQVPTPERLAEFEGDDVAAMDEAHASASSGTVLGGEESCARGFGARGAAGRGRCRTGRGDQAAGGAKRGAGQPLRRSARIALRQESRSAGSGGVGPAQRQSGKS